MEINKNFYIAIFLIGSVFALLSLASDFGTDSAITIFFFTIALILLIKLIVEYRYYRRYNAPLAAGVFLLIPSALALGASYVARHPALNGNPFFADNILFITLDFTFFPIRQLILFLNSFSLVFALPFYLIVLILLYRYYTGIYPRLFIMRKKFYKQFAMYYNILLMSIIIFVWLSTNVLEIFELVFIIVSIIFIVRTYVFKVVLVPTRVTPSRQRRAPTRRAYTPNPSRTISPSGSSSYYDSNTNRPQRPIQPVRNQPVVRNPTPISTPPVAQVRAPVRSTQSTPSGNIEVVDGLSVEHNYKPKGSGAKVTKENFKDFIPNATNLSEDDFRCIFCYELPIKSSDQVAICPNCKKPSHYPEYQKWTSYSNFCSYCNQDIGKKIPKRISGKLYKNVVRIALK